MKHLSAIAVCILALGLSACESMSPATYSNFADNSVALRMYPNAKVAVASMEDASRFDSGCRLVGPITASGNRTVPQFIHDSFNEELKFANIYSTDQGAAALKLTLVSATFSSTAGLVNGWWEFTVKLDNPANGRSLMTNTKFDFQSGFSAVAACQNTSVSLTPAVQRLINKTITDPNFRQLVSP